MFLCLLGRICRVMWLAVAIGSVGISASTTAQSEKWGTEFDALLERPDVEVSLGPGDYGGEERTLHLPGQVTVVERRLNGEITTITYDASGKGAVLCSWKFLAAVKAGYGFCSKNPNRMIEGKLDRAIGRIERFIAANWVEPTSIEQVQRWRHEILEDFFNPLGLEQWEPRICQVEDFQSYISHFESLPEGEFERETDELLSIPRVPAMNPCF